MPEDLSKAYENGSFIPNAQSYPVRWSTQAEAFRSAMGPSAKNADYAGHPRHTLDLFLPDSATPAGLMVFIHGGYWQAFDKNLWSHLAAGAVARGWAVAVPSYTLAPEARISQITTQIAMAIDCAAKQARGPIVVTGHSAGGHLAARMACTDQEHAWSGRLRKVVPISPLTDLRPLMQTAMNATLNIDTAEAGAESPALLHKRTGVDCTVWVGGQERPSFLWQARTLSENWDCPWHVEAGRHHFDVIDGLTDADSALMHVLLD